MKYIKTEKGRAALADRRALSPRERQFLILADGTRDLGELARCVGGVSDATVSRLLVEGYLMRVTSALSAIADFTDTGTVEFMPTQLAPEPARSPVHLVTSTPALAASTTTVAAPVAAAPVAATADTTATTSAPAATPAAASTAAEPAPAPAGSTGLRRSRSFMTTKMYLAGLLQDSAEGKGTFIAASLHVAQHPAELRHWALQALLYLQAQRGDDYAASVTERVLEVFPEASLPVLLQDLRLVDVPAIAQVVRTFEYSLSPARAA